MLTPQAVSAIFTLCLFKDGEDTSVSIAAEGITLSVGFHPGRLHENESQITELLSELPDSFMANSGGGMSFLNACMDKNGNLWTGVHAVVEQLFLLGLALGKVKCLLPRDMWTALPGGMPYFVVFQ